MGKFKIKYEEIANFAKEHPELLQVEVGKHFGVGQSTVSLAMRSCGVEVPRRGRPKLKKRAGQTDLQHEWEQRLSHLGLGMDVGIGKLSYQEDPYAEKFHES